MSVVIRKEVNGYRIEIIQDEFPENPRELNENFGTILYKNGSRYNLGDEEAYQEDMDGIENNPDFISLPVYAYIHSGVILNTTGFSCPWDSGKCGIIYVSKEDARKSFEVKVISAKIREKVLECLKSEVEEYSRYLGGEVYGYRVLDRSGEEVDSCWGLVGIEYAIEEAEMSAKDQPEQEEVGV